MDGAKWSRSLALRLQTPFLFDQASSLVMVDLSASETRPDSLQNFKISIETRCAGRQTATRATRAHTHLHRHFHPMLDHPDLQSRAVRGCALSVTLNPARPLQTPRRTPRVRDNWSLAVGQRSLSRWKWGRVAIYTHGGLAWPMAPGSTRDDLGLPGTTEERK